MSLPRNLSLTTAADIDALVAERAEEGPHLDLKRDLPGRDNQSRHELLADVSAFANSTGGDVVFGVDEDGEARASTVVPQPGNSDEEARRVQDILMNGVEPRIPGLQVVAVPIGGGFVLIIRGPQSWAGPHRVKTNQHFFIREEKRKRQLDMPEIRGLFVRSEQQAQKVRDFRTERLGRLIAGDPPHKLVPGSMLVVHLVPTQAALGLVQIDPVPFTDQRALPALGVTVPAARLNIDGALAVRNPGPQGTHGYSLFFRNGFFETVKVLTRDAEETHALLRSPTYEAQFIELLRGFRVELQHLGIGEEMTCMVALLNADVVRLALTPLLWALEADEGLFDRKTLVLPDVLLAADGPPDRVLRPVFDLVWQSAGLTQSGNYDAQGNWAPR